MEEKRYGRSSDIYRRRERKMDCNKEVIDLMHTYLDGDITKEQEDVLRKHLEHCEDCQKHFHELNRTITFIKSPKTMQAPPHFTNKVMQQLPAEKKWMKYGRWFKRHPIFTAVAIFILFFGGSLVSSWSEENKLVVSKQENLIIEGDTVIVPAGVTVSGDLVVKNGKLIIDGIVDGNVTLINSVLVEEDGDEGLLASVGEVHGELTTVDQLFEWIWYQAKQMMDNIFSLQVIQITVEV